MQELLKKLNQCIGVKGSMLVEQNGLVAMAELGEDLDQETVAAMACNTIRSTKKALDLLGHQKFDRFIIIAAHGRIVCVDISPAILLVVTEKNINIDYTLLEIDGIAKRITNYLS